MSLSIWILHLLSFAKIGLNKIYIEMGYFFEVLKNNDYLEFQFLTVWAKTKVSL